MKDMKVYLAGKMTGLTIQEMTAWREKATDKLTEHGIIALNPVNTELGNNEILEQEILASNKYMIRKSDVILAEFDFGEVSIGTVGEVVYAYQHGIPVIVWGKSKAVNNPWIKGHIAQNFLSLDNAIAYIVRNYKF